MDFLSLFLGCLFGVTVTLVGLAAILFRGVIDN